MNKEELQNEIAKLSRNESVSQLVAMQMKIPQSEVPQLLREFELWELSSEKYLQENVSEIYRHFLCWTRKKPDNNLTTINKAKAYGMADKLDAWESACQDRVFSVLRAGGFHFN